MSQLSYRDPHELFLSNPKQKISVSCKVNFIAHITYTLSIHLDSTLLNESLRLGL